MKQNIIFLLATICFTSILLVCVQLSRFTNPWKPTYLNEADGTNKAIISGSQKSFGTKADSNKTEKIISGSQQSYGTIADSKKANKTVNVNSRSKTNVNNNSQPINPGCIAKNISKYRALDSGKNYAHPNIVHFAKFYKSSNYSVVSLNFREYISVMSTYKFLKPEKIVFHTYSNFSGKYWDKIKKFKNVQVEVNVIPPVNTIGGRRTVYIQHQADFVKLSMLYKYGGTALDFDVIMVNGTRWKYLQSKSECILVDERGLINGGLYSCIKSSSFIAKWLESYHKQYRPQAWLYNASHKPVQILQQGNVCYNIHVDRTVCLNPTWGEHMRWLKVNGTVWRSKTAIHYYVKTGIPSDGEGLLTANFSLAEVVQYVYNAK